MKTWAIDRKVTKELKAFDGSSLSYKSWHDRIVDHVMRCNVHWGEVLSMVEKVQTPLTWTKLAEASPMITVATHGYTCDYVSLAKTLWSFIG